LKDLHQPTPWSTLRWDFVTEGLLQRTPRLWWGSVESIALALQGARSVRWHSDAHIDGHLEHLRKQLQSGPAKPSVTGMAESYLFTPVETYCESFSKWWRLTRLAH